MTKLISSLQDNILQAPLQQTEGISSSYSSTVISNVARKCINNAAKEATASHNLTSCPNSEVLSNKSKAAKKRSKDPKHREKMSKARKIQWENPEYREKMSKVRKIQWANPKYREKTSEKMSKAAKGRWANPEPRENKSKAMKCLWRNPEYREKMSKAMKCLWRNPEYREKMSEKMSKAAKGRWEDPEYRKKNLNSRKSNLKNPERIQLSRQRADEAIASILAQTQQQKIKVEPQEDVLPKGDTELQMTGYSRVIHEINNNLPILQDPNDPTHSLFYELEGSVDQIKISRYGELKLCSSQKKQILEEVKEWIKVNENDREVYQQKLDELFEISIPIEIGPDRGRSVYAKRNIRKLEVVGPYAGILQRSEEEFRYSIRQKGSYNVLSYLFGTRSKCRSIDGFGMGNTTSLINTGQLPGNPTWNDNNLTPIQVGKNLNFYVAKRDICQGEELLIDYGPDYNPMCFLKVEPEDHQRLDK